MLCSPLGRAVDVLAKHAQLDEPVLSACPLLSHPESVILVSERTVRGSQSPVHALHGILPHPPVQHAAYTADAGSLGWAKGRHGADMEMCCRPYLEKAMLLPAASGPTINVFKCLAGGRSLRVRVEVTRRYLRKPLLLDLQKPQLICSPVNQPLLTMNMFSGGPHFWNLLFGQATTPSMSCELGREGRRVIEAGGGGGAAGGKEGRQEGLGGIVGQKLRCWGS